MSNGVWFVCDMMENDVAFTLMQAVLQQMASGPGRLSSRSSAAEPLTQRLSSDPLEQRQRVSHQPHYQVHIPSHEWLPADCKQCLLMQQVNATSWTFGQSYTS